MKPLLISLVLACVAACGGPAAQIVHDEASAVGAVGHAVLFEGTAGNARLAAAVVHDGLVIYCLDRAEWPDALVGTTVTVRGRLERSHEFEGGRDASGSYRSGTEGAVFVVRSCDVVDPAQPPRAAE